MRKWVFSWIITGLAAAVCAAALIFFGKIPGLLAAAAAAAAWAVFFARFCSVRYEFSEEEIRVFSGLFFRSSRAVKRAAILSQSRFCIGKLLLFSVVRRSGATLILFCDIPEN